MKYRALSLLLCTSAALGECPHFYVHFEPWGSGDRIAFCAPLPDVLTEFNRHNVLQLVLVGSPKKWPTVEGDYLAREPEELLEKLLNSHTVTIVSGSEKEHVFRLALAARSARGLRK